MASNVTNLTYGDSGPTLLIPLTDGSTGNVINLTTMTSAQAIWRQVGTTTELATLTATVNGSPLLGIIAVALGTTLQLPATCPVVPGYYEFQVKLTFTGPQIISVFNPFRCLVQASF